MANKKLGRPTVFTDEVLRKIEEVAALDGSIEEMAYYAGINRSTLYSYIEDHPDFSERIAALRKRPILKARQTIVRALDDPNHAFKYLEKKRKQEFGNSIDITTGGDSLNPVLVKFLDAKDNTDTDGVPPTV